MVAAPEKCDADWPACFCRAPGRDNTVPTVITRRSQDNDRPHLPTPFDFVGHGAADICHQVDDWRAGGNRQAIGFGHLSDAKER
jgi:hypothetical protein